jgi:predicted HicB family RNase H-like nuclease
MIYRAMSKYTAFRCPEDLLELAKIKAKKDRRSLSNYIITLIEKDVREDADSDSDDDSKKPQLARARN